VPWRPSWKEIRAAARDSLAFVGRVYGVRSNGDLEYEGTRPGPEWQVLGWFSRHIRVLRDGRPVRLVLWKRRWWNPIEGRSCHSRPPDENGAISSCLLFVILALFATLDGSQGPERCPQIHPHMEDVVCPRTVSRWRTRAARAAPRLQQALRRAVIERCEPRPVERLFPGGLSPPLGLRRRRWKRPSPMFALWRGITFLLGGAVRLGVSTALLLAEARGRTSHPTRAWF
jgi:hypothetical protein